MRDEINFWSSCLITLFVDEIIEQFCRHSIVAPPVVRKDKEGLTFDVTLVFQVIDKVNPYFDYLQFLSYYIPHLNVLHALPLRIHGKHIEEIVADVKGQDRK